MNKSGKVTRWWWVRHAPVVDHDGKIYGQGDVGCDTSDSRSFEGLAGKIPAGAVWVTSNLRRTAQTASAILAAGSPAPAAGLQSGTVNVSMQTINRIKEASASNPANPHTHRQQGQGASATYCCRLAPKRFA